MTIIALFVRTNMNYLKCHDKREGFGWGRKNIKLSLRDWCQAAVPFSAAEEAKRKTFTSSPLYSPFFQWPDFHTQFTHIRSSFLKFLSPLFSLSFAFCSQSSRMTQNFKANEGEKESKGGVEFFNCHPSVSHLLSFFMEGREGKFSLSHSLARSSHQYFQLYLKTLISSNMLVALVQRTHTFHQHSTASPFARLIHNIINSLRSLLFILIFTCVYMDGMNWNTP